MLTLKRFKALMDSYGAKPERWPEAMRAEAEALLRISPEARQLLAAARELDEAIDAARDTEHALSWSSNDEAAALARLRASVAARIDDSSRQDLSRHDPGAAAGTRHTAPDTARAAPQAAPGPAHGIARRLAGGRGQPAASAWRQRLHQFAQWSTPARALGMGAAGGFVIAVGLLLGSMDTPQPTPQVDVLAVLQPDPLPFLVDQ
jgi:hypothetical protein